MRLFVKTAAAAWTQAAPTALFGCACTIMAPWHATDAVFARASSLIHELRNEFKRVFDGSHGYSMLTDDTPDDTKL